MSLSSRWEEASKDHQKSKIYKADAHSLRHPKEGEDPHIDDLLWADDVSEEKNPHPFFRFVGGLSYDLKKEVSGRVRILIPHEDQGKKVPLGERLTQLGFVIAGDVMNVCGSVKDAVEKVVSYPYHQKLWESTIERNKE